MPRRGDGRPLRPTAERLRADRPGRPLWAGVARTDESCMHDRATWDNLWKWVVGLAACAALGWFAFVRGTSVPLLWMVDLGFHELGHLVTRWLPEVVMAMMGSITQVAVPIGMAVYFLLVRRDLLAGALCLAWASTSAQNASVYIADAPYQRLQLIGGFHDWAFVLGPDHFDMLNRAALIAGVVKGFGVVLWLAAVGLCVAGLMTVGRKPPAEAATPWPDFDLSTFEDHRFAG